MKKIKDGTEPATKENKDKLKEYCKSMCIDFKDIYTWSPGYITTREDIRNMYQLVHDAAMKNASSRKNIIGFI